MAGQRHQTDADQRLGMLGIALKQALAGESNFSEMAGQIGRLG